MTEPQYDIDYTAQGRFLIITGEMLPKGLNGERTATGWRCPCDAANAAAIRRILPWSAPQVVVGRMSIGLGDRLGIATPGHLRAVREGSMFPVLAQQSMREMGRAGRTPQDVLDDATWGVIAVDYRGGWGCDADHLKTAEDIDACTAAGYISYTLDPGAFVDDAANSADEAALAAKVAALPWFALETSPEANASHYTRHAERPMAHRDYLRAAAKYGKALAQVKLLADRIAERMGDQTYDLEVSVDETETETTLAEHEYIAEELRRLGIPFTGLAPRFVGEFEKGVDYIGDLAAFEASFAQHAALAERGGYKLSIHSGSDKFSIFPIIARHAAPNVHVKTSGTSWLEALRAIAMTDAPLFRSLLALAVETYETNRASYHVSGQIERIPLNLNDAELPTLLDQFDAREVLHVSFGVALARYRDPIYAALYADLEAYWSALHRHFRRHIAPFNR